MTWTMSQCTDYDKARKDFEKKWPDEMRAVMNNLWTVVQSLEDGARPEQLKHLHSFVHGNYSLNIFSIDESGHEKRTKPKALRLYLFACEEEQTLYVMLLGDKATQAKDVKLCSKFVSKKKTALNQQREENKKKK